jgi:hypothetical protein
LQRKLAVPRIKVKPLLGLARASSIFAGRNRPGPFKFLDERIIFKYFLIAAVRVEKKFQSQAKIGHNRKR